MPNEPSDDVILLSTLSQSRPTLRVLLKLALPSTWERRHRRYILIGVSSLIEFASHISSWIHVVALLNIVLPKFVLAHSSHSKQERLRQYADLPLDALELGDSSSNVAQGDNMNPRRDMAGNLNQSRDCDQNVSSVMSFPSMMESRDTRRIQR
eukprot:Gb_27358 [translate_table: standard]